MFPGKFKFILRIVTNSCAIQTCAKPGQSIHVLYRRVASPVNQFMHVLYRRVPSPVNQFVCYTDVCQARSINYVPSPVNQFGVAIV